MSKAGKETIGNFAIVIEKFLDNLNTHMPNMQYVYCEKLDYESVLKKFKADNNMNENEEVPFPLFSFKRSVLRHSDHGMSRRAVTQRVLKKQDDDYTAVYKMVYGEFDIDFLFIVKEAHESEIFEINYLAEEGIASQKEIKVTLGDLGEFPYQFQYEPLTDKEMEKEINYYKGITGSVRASGLYFIHDSVKPHIKHINFMIKNFNDKVLRQKTIEL